MPATSRLNRRTFLVASGLGLGGVTFGRPQRMLANADAQTTGGKAKSTILFFLCGGASHIDTWDMKPHAPAEYRGPFEPISTSAPGLTLCEHLPLLAEQAHHLAAIRSVSGTVNTNDHHAGYYYNLTGHVPDVTLRPRGMIARRIRMTGPIWGRSSRPSDRLIRTAERDLPAAHAEPQTVHAARSVRCPTGVEYDPLYLNGSRDEPLKFESARPSNSNKMSPPVASLLEVADHRSTCPTRVRRAVRLSTDVEPPDRSGTLSAFVIQDH
ncbi:MAG: DUF1501 domain-containing protein [Planctomycetaceae bacterium]